MQLHDLHEGEKFKFNGHVWTLLRKIPYHVDVYDCLDDGQRHRPFKGNVEVEPLQMRLEV